MARQCWLMDLHSAYAALGRGLIAVVLSLMLMSGVANAAEITVEPAAGNGFTVVAVKEKIEPGDDEKFKAVTLDLTGPVLVAFVSKGGNVRGGSSSCAARSAAMRLRLGDTEYQ